MFVRMKDNNNQTLNIKGLGGGIEIEVVDPADQEVTVTVSLDRTQVEYFIKAIELMNGH